MALQFNQAAQEGIYLRFPDNIAPQRELSYENAINMLLRGAVMAQNVPFTWAYIDKPMDGSLFLLFHPQNVPFAIDGLRFQDSETKYPIPAGARELEVAETKFGFAPGAGESAASRVRRRYRLTKGGNPQLMLVHYTRGQPTHIQPALNTPVRIAPMRPINEPAMYVAGEKIGQKVFPPGAGGSGGGGGGVGGVPGAMAPPPPGMGGLQFNQQQALLAQQNSSMEALERRRERERQQQQQQQQERGPRGEPVGGRPPPQRMPEDDDSGDEVDQISSRTLALARYKRNHDWMNDVFNQAAFGARAAPPKPAYSIFAKADIEAKTAKLQAELEALQGAAALRRADAIRAVQGGVDAPSVAV